MCLTDPIADMITRMRNALALKKESVMVSASNIKTNILNVLLEEGYINSFEKIDVDGIPSLKIVLRYYANKPVITTLKRISKPGCRKYNGFKSLKKVRGGLGISVVSTPQGVLSSEEARKRRVGGEVLVEVF